MKFPTPLLRESQRTEVFVAIRNAGLDLNAFDLADDGVDIRVEHTLSSACFTFYRDRTRRYLGTYYVGFGPQRSFDRSWQAVISLVGVWLAELKHDLHTQDL
jgi:hypothetical protein